MALRSLALRCVRLRKAIQKQTGERYASKKVCSTTTTALHNTNLICLCAQRARICQCYRRSVLTLAGSCLDAFSEDSKVTVNIHIV